MSYTLAPVSDPAEVQALLESEGLQLDPHLDYTCAVFDEGGAPIATGSCYGNTLRCFAVDGAHRGEGLLSTVLTHLCEVECQRGNLRLFLYTKGKAAPLFGDLGFYEIARTGERLVFMENRRNGFSNAVAQLAATRRPGVSGALVMNANPFTLGHQYLAEQAAAACDTLHLFVVSEDVSLVPFSVRRELVAKGVAHLPNVILHDSGPYIISNATFPSYFLGDEASVAECHARLDLAVFAKIAAALGITRRYVGEEPASQITALYNRVMAQELPKAGVACIVLPRKTAPDGQIISASTARRLLQEGAWDALAEFLPPASLAYFRSPAAAPVLAQLRQAKSFVHC